MKQSYIYKVALHQTGLKKKKKCASWEPFKFPFNAVTAQEVLPLVDKDRCGFASAGTAPQEEVNPLIAF